MPRSDAGRPAPRVVARGVVVEYGQGPVLRGVDLDLAGPGSVAIMGPSGSGKTTLLYALAGLERLDSGSVNLLGLDIGSSREERVQRLRLAHVGFVFQRADLVPELTLAENIGLPLELLGRRRRETRDRVGELLERLDLVEAAGRKPSAVSGGQAQRAAIARAVAARPSLVLADEPTGALDSTNGDRVLDLLLGEVTALGSLLVMVTHDAGVAARLDAVVRLRDGVVDGGTALDDARGLRA